MFSFILQNVPCFATFFQSPQLEIVAQLFSILTKSFEVKNWG